MPSFFILKGYQRLTVYTSCGPSPIVQALKLVSFAIPKKEYELTTILGFIQSAGSFVKVINTNPPASREPARVL